MVDSGAKKEPFLKNLSETAMVLYGFKDGHGVVKVKLPVPGNHWYSVDISVDMILKFKTNFEDAYQYGQKKASERTKKEPVEFMARSDCKGRWGYEDGHVELSVKKILVWIPIKFTWEEFLLAKKVMDEAHAWATLPEDVRKMQGV